MEESKKSVSELIDNITRMNAFHPADNPNSTGLSPDLTDEDIAGVIERGANMNGAEYEDAFKYRYYFDEENCILYKSGYEGSLEEYIEGRLWNAVSYEDLIDSLVEVSEEEADAILKEIEGDEYDLVDGYVLEDYSGEV